MKKTFLQTLNIPLSPSSFHIFIHPGKKNINLHPPPLNNKKIEGKKSTCTLLSSPLAQ
jgi:hypothetical protein